MNKNSTNYTFIFVFILTLVVAVVLTGFRQMTAETAKKNEDIFNKRAILLAVQDHLPGGKLVDELKDEEVLSIFDNMEKYVVNSKGGKVEGVEPTAIDLEKEAKKEVSEQQFPLYIFKKGDKSYYILSIRGKGLWDDIWGCVALESDFNTIAGAAFDHKGETPGLGAEIKDNADFANQFKGKQILENDQYVSIAVTKGKGNESVHNVDGISGATITGNGVTNMLYKGIDFYQPYLKTLKK